ncbi:MAG TPA: serine hydrolase domain-containing protein [Fimbriimonadaceae bacterium]|nr:serine hydrolase domain-containing protein [Fimbriimonadaceae bacterium]
MSSIEKVARLFSVISSLTLLAASSIAQTDPAFDARLERHFRNANVPGMVVAVYREGNLIFSREFGVANEESKSAIRKEMGYEIGSLSKLFTSVAVLKLVSEGKLSLADKLSKHFTDLPAAWGEATVEQVLHHISGIPDYEEPATYDFYNKPRTFKEVIDVVAAKGVDFAPGEKFNYSNTGYFVMSALVERMAGVPVGRFLQDRIFRPLGMANTYASDPVRGLSVAQGYHSRTGSRGAQPPIAWTSTLGAGGIVSTVADMAKWDMAQYGESLAPRPLVDKLWEPAKLNNGQTSNYGLGWVVGQFRGIRRLGHTGQTNGFTCSYERFPDSKTAIFVWCNTYGGRVGAMAQVLASRFVPGASYAQIPIPDDPDRARTDSHLAALKTAIAGQGDASKLHDGIKALATSKDYEGIRNQVRPWLDSTKGFRFVRLVMRKSAAGQDIQELLYRHDYEGGTVYWLVRVLDGTIVGLSWDDE